MLELIIALILGLAIGFGIGWLIMRKIPQDKIREINYERLREEQEMFEKRKREEEQEIKEILNKRVEAYKDYEDTRREYDEMNRRISLLTTQRDVLSNDVTHLMNQREDISRSLEQSRLDAENAAKTFLKQQIELAQEQLDRSLEIIAKQYQDAEEECKEHYLQMAAECADTMTAQMDNLTHDYIIMEAAFAELRSKVDVAVKASKREEEKRQEKNFYRLVLPESVGG